MPPIAKKPRKRRHVERPDIRATLIDAAESLIREEGYAAATVRRIATQIGLKHQVVYYYFGSLDELLLALVERVAAQHHQQLSAALAGDEPLRAIWNMVRDPESTRFTLELMALANHNEQIRDALAKNADVARILETDGITAHLKARGIKPRVSPQLVSILTNSLARLLVQEANLGIHRGHDEAEAMVTASLTNFESRGDYVAALGGIIDEMKDTVPASPPGRRTKGE